MLKVTFMNRSTKLFLGDGIGGTTTCVNLFFPGQLAFCKKAVVGLAARRIF